MLARERPGKARPGSFPIADDVRHSLPFKNKLPSSDSEYIQVPDDFVAKEGTKLTDELSIDRPLGIGLQVQL